MENAELILAGYLAACRSTAMAKKPPGHHPEGLSGIPTKLDSQFTFGGGALPTLPEPSNPVP